METNTLRRASDAIAGIDCLDSLSRSEFNREYFNKKPVIVKQAMAHTRSYNNWTLDYLRDTVGSRSVVIKHSITGKYNITMKDQFENVTVPFDKAIELFTSPEYSNKSYYLQQSSIFEHFPELMQDLELPDLNGDSDNLEVINFWMGGAGCVTHLHYDRDNNFLAQIKGRKEILFFAPGDIAYLYPNKEFKHAHVSQIDLDNVDHERFPLFEKATKYYGLLDAGDLLYLPPGWWHQVRSLDMSISVNFWWNRFDVEEGMGLELLDLEQLCFMIKSFTDKGFTINYKDEEGEYLLVKAVQKGYPTVVEAFLMMGANLDTISAVYKPGKSVFAIAQENGQKEIVQLLERYRLNKQV